MRNAAVRTTDRLRPPPPPGGSRPAAVRRDPPSPASRRRRRERNALAGVAITGAPCAVATRTVTATVSARAGTAPGSTANRACCGVKTGRPAAWSSTAPLRISPEAGAASAPSADRIPVASIKSDPAGAAPNALTSARCRVTRPWRVGHGDVDRVFPGRAAKLKMLDSRPVATASTRTGTVCCHDWARSSLPAVSCNCDGEAVGGHSARTARYGVQQHERHLAKRIHQGLRAARAKTARGQLQALRPGTHGRKGRECRLTSTVFRTRRPLKPWLPPSEKLKKFVEPNGPMFRRRNRNRT